MTEVLHLLVHRHIYDPADADALPEPEQDGEPLFWDDADETFKILGLYSSRERALAHVDALRAQPGFEASPDGFSVHEYTVDQVRWADGFSVTEL